MRYKITINDYKNNSFLCRDDETILEAALSAGINIPFSCRQGNCKSCIIKKLSGNIDYANSHLLFDEDEKILTCQAYPLSDLVLEFNLLAFNAGITTKVLPTRIIAIDRKNYAILLKLKLPSHENFKFLPGQYINILLKNNQKRSYSIASKTGEDFLELHIKNYQNGLFSELLLTLKAGDLLRIEGPLGNFVWKTTDKKVLLIASGTGFAPFCSMLKTHLDSYHSDIHFFWIVKNKDYIYSTLPREWQKAYDRFQFFPILRNEVSQPIHALLFQNYPHLKDFDIYLCGSATMINITLKALLEAQFPKKQVFADVFLPTGSY